MKTFFKPKQHVPCHIYFKYAKCDRIEVAENGWFLNTKPHRSRVVADSEQFFA